MKSLKNKAFGLALMLMLWNPVGSEVFAAGSCTMDK